ncbi:MAG: glycosyltransferase family 9 protein [Pirellulales bacterium]|nr:glycosyltransferase family 9 protein [Pirellulales bacterium]
MCANRQKRGRVWSSGRYRYVRMRWRVLFAMIDWLGAKLAPRSASAQCAPRRILIIQLDHLGDAIISRPMIVALQAAWPLASIDVYCGAWTQDFFARLSEIEQIHVSRFNRFARDWRRMLLAWLPAYFYQALAMRGRYDMAIDVRGEFPNALWMCLAKIPRRVGWDAGGGGFLLTDSPCYVPERAEHLSRRALLSAIGVEIAPRSELNFEPGAAARSAIAQRLGEVWRPLVVAHIGAGTEAKRWSARRWMQWAERTALDSDARVILVGARSECAIAHEIMAGLTPAARASVEDWTGELTLSELAALVAKCDVYVGADSGPAHLAALVGAPSVVLFSGTNLAAQWRPHSNGAPVTVLRESVACSPCHHTRCPLADHPCMQHTAFEVWQAVDCLLCDSKSRSECEPIEIKQDEQLGATR